jgi:hypothetical protein
MRDVVCIYTGQGAAGDLRQIAIYTGQFSSCSPVVMFNTATHGGGVYHLPGKRGDVSGLQQEWPNLQKLLDLVKPTKILLFPCGDYRRRQEIIEGGVSSGAPQPNDEDIIAAGGKYSAARQLAFDRVFAGDQRELSKMFANAKAFQNMSYNVQLLAEGRGGIQVTADDTGELRIFDSLTTLGGRTYDLYRRQTPPEELCTILSPSSFNYSLWIPATSS